MQFLHPTAIRGIHEAALINLSSHNEGERSAPWGYASAESKAIFPGEQVDVTDKEINRWGGGGGKKRVRKSIDQGIDCLAGSQVCISQVTHTSSWMISRRLFTPQSAP